MKSKMEYNFKKTMRILINPQYAEENEYYINITNLEVWLSVKHV